MELNTLLQGEGGRSAFTFHLYLLGHESLGVAIFLRDVQ
jgi:hypothetical protein